METLRDPWSDTRHRLKVFSPWLKAIPPCKPELARGQPNVSIYYELNHHSVVRIYLAQVVPTQIKDLLAFHLGMIVQKSTLKIGLVYKRDQKTG